MSLYTRIVLVVSILLVLATVALSAALIWVAQQAVIDSSRRGAEAVAQLLAQSSAFANDVSAQTETLLGNQMVIQARLAAQLVSVAEAGAGLSPDEIDAILKTVSDETVASDKTAALEFWITDENGHAYLTNTGQDFTFSPNPLQQPQMHVFWELLKEKNGAVIQDARRREAGLGIYKYVGVSGVDKPRIVQVGYSAPVLENLRSNAALQKMIDALTDSGTATSTLRSDIKFIRVLNEYSSTTAKSSHPQRDYLAGSAEWALIGDARRENKTFSQYYPGEGVLRAAAPVVDDQGRNRGAVFVYQSDDRIKAATNAAVVRGVVLTTAALLVGIFASVILALSIARPVRQLGQAAQTLARGDWQQEIRPSSIGEIDALGKAFTSMVAQLKESYAGLHESNQQLQRRVAELTTLQQVSMRLGASLNPDEVMHAVAESIRALIGATDVRIFHYDAEHDELRQVVVLSHDEYKAEFDVAPRSDGLTATVARTGKPWIINDAASHPLYANAVIPWAPGDAIAGIPITHAGRTLAVLNVGFFNQPHQFTDDEVRVLTMVADEAALAMENARLYQESLGLLENLGHARDKLAGWNQELEHKVSERTAELAQRAEQLDLINRVGRNATSMLDQDALLPHVVHLIRDAFNYYAVMILLSDQEASEICLSAAATAEKADALECGLRLPLGDQSITGYVAFTGEPLVAGDVSVEPRFRYEERLPRTHSELALPLRIGDQVLGVLDLESEKVNAFTSEDVQVLRTLADQIAVALHNAELFEDSRQRIAELATLNKIGQAFSTSLQVEQLPELIYRQVTSIFEADSFYLALYDKATDEWATIFDITRGEHQTLMRRKSDTGLTGYIIRTGRPLLMADRAANLAFYEKIDVQRIGEQAKSWLGVPLIAANQVIGVMGIESYEHENLYNAQAQNLLSTIAAQAANAIENARLYQAEIQARRAADTLRETGQLINSTLNLDEVLARILASLSTVLDCDSAEIMLLKDNVLYAQAVQGLADPTATRGFQLALADYPLNRQVVETAEPVIIGDVQADPRWQVQEVLGSSRIRTWMGIPLVAAGQVIGMLTIDNYRPGVYNQTHLPLATVVANQAATALHNAELFRAAQEARAEAEEANRLKSQFLANMSHELRTPLNSVINFAYLLTMGTEGPLTPGQEDLLNRIGEAGRHLLGLINDILDLAKIEAGRLELFFEDIDLHELIGGVMSTAVGLLRGKPIELRRETPADLPLVRADRTRVRQVLLNLLSNAAKFTDSGQITVRAWADTPPVPEGNGGSQERGWVTLSVQDTGIGMAEQDIPKAFAEFVQLDGQLTRQAGGTGLGLPISKRFVEMHGGRIWVESQPGAGSTFYFTLPCVPPPPPSLAGVGGQGGGALTEARVLVIDDDPVARDMIARQLAHGYRVLKLTDSRRAVERVRKDHPDVVVLDVLMPHQDGWEVLKALKTDPQTKDIPVVVCSVLREQQLALSLGAGEYLVKPVEREDLRRVVGRFAPPGGKVLAVDDDLNALEIVGRMLDGMSYQVITAHDGQAGLEAVREQAPDVVVLDLMMPGLSGFEVLAELRADPRTANLPVVVVTAKDLTAEERAQLQAEAAALLQKGQYTADEFVNTVRRAVTHGSQEAPHG